MATMGVDDGSLQAGSQPKSVGLVWGLAATWHLVCIHQNEPSKLLQWPCMMTALETLALVVLYYY